MAVNASRKYLKNDALIMNANQDNIEQTLEEYFNEK